jgi:hypothetical protein
VKIVTEPRQRGKTTELIRLSAEEDLYIVCANRTEAQRVAGVAREMGLSIPFPLTWGEFASRQYHGRGVKGFAIDNLDACIQQMTPVPIRAVSLTT